MRNAVPALLHLSTVVCLAAVFGSYTQAQALKTKRPAQSSSPAVELDRLPVQGNVHLLSGAGGNVIVQAGSQGVLVVDAGHASAAEPLLENIRGLAGER